MINISYKLLKAFLTLSEHKNFTRAAEHFHVSQATFSGLIQRREEEVGTRLFERDTRNVVLTPEGELFAEAAANLVQDIQWTFSDLKDYVSKKKGYVSIAALPSIACDWLPPLIAEYQRCYPGVLVQLHDLLSDRCLELLQQGQADIALAAPNAALDEYEVEHFYTDRYYVICRRDHPLAGVREISLPELRGNNFIRLARATSVNQHLISSIGDSGVTASSFEVTNLATVAGLILHGLGISLLPELTLSQFRHPDLHIVPLAPPGISRPIYMFRRKGKPLSIAAQAMLELFRKNKPQSGV